jgi:hypothetical protein
MMPIEEIPVEGGKAENMIRDMICTLSIEQES